jgi:hypothetical protein
MLCIFVIIGTSSAASVRFDSSPPQAPSDSFSNAISERRLLLETALVPMYAAATLR